jgi:hypothetical protein
VQYLLPQQEIQKTDLSAHGPISSSSDMLKVAIVEQRIMTELCEAVSGKEENNDHYKNDILLM